MRDVTVWNNFFANFTTCILTLHWLTQKRLTVHFSNVFIPLTAHSFEGFYFEPSYITKTASLKVFKTNSTALLYGWNLGTEVAISFHNNIVDTMCKIKACIQANMWYVWISWTARTVMYPTTKQIVNMRRKSKETILCEL